MPSGKVNMHDCDARSRERVQGKSRQRQGRAERHTAMDLHLNNSSASKG